MCVRALCVIIYMKQIKFCVGWNSQPVWKQAVNHRTCVSYTSLCYLMMFVYLHNRAPNVVSACLGIHVRLKPNYILEFTPLDKSKLFLWRFRNDCQKSSNQICLDMIFLSLQTIVFSWRSLKSPLGLLLFHIWNIATYKCTWIVRVPKTNAVLFPQPPFSQLKLFIRK